MYRWLNVQVVKLLVEKGADINEKDQEGLTALINAAEVGGSQIDGCHG
jgi:ankyrin repeat protein